MMREKELVRTVRSPAAYRAVDVAGRLSDLALHGWTEGPGSRALVAADSRGVRVADPIQGLTALYIRYSLGVRK